LTQNEQKESEEIKKAKLSRQLELIEAALYVSGRPLNLKILGNASRIRSKKKVRKLAKALVEEYNSRKTALEILEVEGERFVMQLKPEFTGKVRKLATRPLLSSGPLKTLSYIAFRQPVLQIQVIEVRGNHSYSHLKQLEEMELIKREGSGKKRIIRTTGFFADYFGLSHELRIMKRQLKSLFKEEESIEEKNQKKS
jgi:segregation and condensation protein B